MYIANLKNFFLLWVRVISEISGNSSSFIILLLYGFNDLLVLIVFVKKSLNNEFNVYYDANWKNISPSIRTGRMNAMSEEDQEILIDKARDCNP